MSRTTNASRGSKTSSIPRSPRRRASTKPGSKSSKSSSSKSTSSKSGSAKSSRTKSKATRGRAARSGRSDNGDLTRPTPRAERLVPKAFGRIVLAIGAVLVVISFGNSFIWLPAKSWMGQRNEASGRQTELDTLRQASDQIQKEIDWLKTPAGIESAARSELGYVMSGEKRKVLVGTAAAPLELPSGWPYDLVTQIVTVLEAEEQQQAARDAGQ